MKFSKHLFNLYFIYNSFELINLFLIKDKFNKVKNIKKYLDDFKFI